VPAFPQNGSAATVALLDHMPPVEEAPARVLVEWDSVVLVTRDSRGSERLVEGLRLALDQRGTGIQRGDCSLVHRLGWDEVVSFRAHPPAEGRRHGVVLDIETEFKVHRFLLMNESLVTWVLDAVAVVVRRHYPGGAASLAAPYPPTAVATPVAQDEPAGLAPVGVAAPGPEEGGGAGPGEGLTAPRVLGWARRPLRLRRRPALPGAGEPGEDPAEAPGEKPAKESADKLAAPTPLRRVPAKAVEGPPRRSALRPLLFLLAGILVIVVGLVFAQLEGFVHVLPHSFGVVGSYGPLTLLR
jgi:hypothetical protein